MPVHFVLKRYLEGFEEYGDLYEAIKSGRKTVEYRDATDHWKVRLLSPKGIIFKDFYQGRSLVFSGDHLKHDKAVFVVGYTKHPKLVVNITKVVYLYDTNQFEIHLINVKENPCNFIELECTKKYGCENCIVYLYGYYKAKESIDSDTKRTDKNE